MSITSADTGLPITTVPSGAAAVPGGGGGGGSGSGSVYKSTTPGAVVAQAPALLYNPVSGALYGKTNETEDAEGWSPLISEP